jgi:ABC-2 type transport system permease protein
MRAVIAVFKREVGLYFRSPVAYAIAFALTLFLSLIFNSYLVQANQRFAAEPSFIPSLLTFLLFLIAPLLTMRLLAEESREGTMEVLMTLPMSEASFIVGKFLAAWFYFTVLLAITLIYQFILFLVGVPDLGVVFTAYLGAWLYGGAVLAVTMIWSAITEDQVVAAFLGAATVLMLYLADFAAIWVSGQATGASGAADFVRELGLQSHYDATMLNGILRVEDILYFVFMMIGALFITTRIVETRRWRA